MSPTPWNPRLLSSGIMSFALSSAINRHKSDPLVLFPGSIPHSLRPRISSIIPALRCLNSGGILIPSHGLWCSPVSVATLSVPSGRDLYPFASRYSSRIMCAISCTFLAPSRFRISSWRSSSLASGFSAILLSQYLDSSGGSSARCSLSRASPSNTSLSLRRPRPPSFSWVYTKAVLIVVATPIVFLNATLIFVSIFSMR
mmetsp:Transcript_22367/g.36096  ORF Transcript_22367/g.36096 Transcript_22367/m.36096 type:complete len:200 (-) Transcript_22367:372-971(-)